MANLIAYYTREGENYWNGSIVALDKGNTERVAEFVQEAVGGDLCRIETVDSYPSDYRACCEVAKRELQEEARPEIRECDVDLGAYDTVFLGYPNWWGVSPMCVLTFLDRFDLSGKRIVPFCTYEGSGMGGSVRLLRKLYPEAKFEDGLAVLGHEAVESRAKVASWAKKMTLQA